MGERGKEGRWGRTEERGGRFERVEEREEEGVRVIEGERGREGGES